MFMYTSMSDGRQRIEVEERTEGPHGGDRAVLVRGVRTRGPLDEQRAGVHAPERQAEVARVRFDRLGRLFAQMLPQSLRAAPARSGAVCEREAGVGAQATRLRHERRVEHRVDARVERVERAHLALAECAQHVEAQDVRRALPNREHLRAHNERRALADSIRSDSSRFH